ncbi:hypothetical protein CRE_06410 [Caenorhabditis remanei]|uniref:G protein-coupled receptor n=1 Tax=Caenorhabditis remanei TaxID=31234 RepID=E3M0S7_CAERE|nr:hypothetical protein CRE_06410 [Caenorhabditis remanei]
MSSLHYCSFFCKHDFFIDIFSTVQKIRSDKTEMVQFILMYAIDFSEPAWLINYYHFIGTISILLNSFGIYLLMFQCRSLDSFRYYLLVFQNLREYSEGFRSIKHFEVYIKTLSIILLFIGSFLGGVTLILLFLIFMVDIFKMMYQLKPIISKYNYEKHIEAIRTLTIQFATASFCPIGPPCMIAILAVSEVDQAQFLTELCVAWFTAYSSENTISMLIFFLPFRKFVLTKLRCRQLKLRREIRVASSVMI